MHARSSDISVPRETQRRLEHLSSLIIDENRRQNLVSATTLADFESRHIVDSLQLLPFCSTGPLLDIGSGAGFPGLVLACMLDAPVHLAEPRRLRADFLARAADAIGLSNVTVHQARIEQVEAPAFATITARAVMPLANLFAAAQHVSDPDTVWVLPKGRSAQSELEHAMRSWHGRFELVPSSTDPTASIVIARKVREREHR